MSRSQSYPPSRRLHYTWEYRRFFDKSEVFRLSECIIFRIPNELAHYRLGITVKAKTDSVRRNRAKRQIREAFRKRESILGSFDYNVVIPGHKKITHPFPIRLRECLANELERSLLRKKP